MFKPISEFSVPELPGDAEVQKLLLELEDMDFTMDLVVPHEAPAVEAPAPKPPQAASGGRRRKITQQRRTTNLRPAEKQLLEVQNRLDGLFKEYQAAEVENNRLKTRIKVIEAVLPMRKPQLQHTLFPFPSSAVELGLGRAVAETSPSVPTESRAALSNGRAAPSALDRGPATSWRSMDSGTPSTSASGSGYATVSTSSQGPQQRHHHGADSGDVGATAATALPAAAAGAASPGDDEAKAALWLAAWRAWVREAALLVAAYNARPRNDYLQRMEAAFDRLKAQVVEFGLPHPEVISNMAQLNLETGEEEEPPFSFWEVAVQGMQVTPAQVMACRAALALYRERMEVVMAQRRSLTDRLASSLQLAEVEEGGATQSMRYRRAALEAESAAAALDTNVAAEGHATRLARDLLRSSIFTPLQRARVSVLCYPYYPDALALLATIAGEKEPLALSGSGAPGR